MKRCIISGIAVAVFFVTTVCSSQPAPQSKQSSSPAPAQAAKPANKARITYSVAKSGDGIIAFGILRATFNGKSSVLISKKEKMCLEIVAEKDFDGDGLRDALVKHIVGCGGNCCSDSFLLVSARPDGHFEVSPEFADSWKDPVIEKWKGRWSIVVVSDNAGMNTDPPVEFTRRFVFEDGKPVKVEEHLRPTMKSIVELRSNMFKRKDPEETIKLKYDLDGDGKKDTIIGKYWDRWGSMIWTVEFADGKTYSSEMGCKRVGVLATKSNGVHDIVCDQNSVFRWDGAKYIEPSD
jgi:hypothetical protein